MMAVPGSLLRGAALASALSLFLTLASSAVAGQWINGGAFDPDRGVGVNFLRFLAGEGEGQMTIRCDRQIGLWIDVGVAGDGQLPAETEVGDPVEATLAFGNGEDTTTIVALGPLLVRGDGAVLISIVGRSVNETGRRLLEPADQLDITIAGITQTLPMEGIAERSKVLAESCGAWPQDEDASIAAD